MKRLSIFLFLLTCIELTKSNAQSILYDSYKGKNVFVKKAIVNRKPFTEILGFFKTPNNDYEPSNIPYPVIDSEGHAYASYRDSLTNKKFYCADIIEIKYGRTYLKLQNDKTGVVYFEAMGANSDLITEDNLQKQKEDSTRTRNEAINKKSSFDKEVDEYNKIIKNPCLQIDESYDDFHYTKKYSTGFLKPEYPKGEMDYPTSTQYYDVVFYKERTKSSTQYYMDISGESSTPLAAMRGVIIILKNKKRINKPLAIVKTKVNESGDNGESYTRSSFIKLTPQDIQLLKSSPISEFELYDVQQNEIDSVTLYQMFLCLLSK